MFTIVSSTTYNLDTNFDYPYNDILSPTGTDTATCRALCDKDTNCVGFVIILNDPNQACWTNSVLTGRISSNGWMTYSITTGPSPTTSLFTEDTASKPTVAASNPQPSQMTLPIPNIDGPVATAVAQRPMRSSMTSSSNSVTHDAAASSPIKSNLQPVPSITTDSKSIEGPIPTTTPTIFKQIKLNKTAQIAPKILSKTNNTSFSPKTQENVQKSENSFILPFSTIIPLGICIVLVMLTVAAGFIIQNRKKSTVEDGERLAATNAIKEKKITIFRLSDNDSISNEPISNAWESYATSYCTLYSTF